jgi:hypothetical protein
MFQSGQIGIEPLGSPALGLIVDGHEAGALRKLTQGNERGVMTETDELAATHGSAAYKVSESVADQALRTEVHASAERHSSAFACTGPAQAPALFTVCESVAAVRLPGTSHWRQSYWQLPEDAISGVGLMQLFDCGSARRKRDTYPR